MSQEIDETNGLAERVRRAREVFDRLIRAVDGMAKEIDRGDMPEDDVLKGARALAAMLPTLVGLECKLDDIKIVQQGGVPGYEAPMDLAAARVEVMGRLARITERG